MCIAQQISRKYTIIHLYSIVTTTVRHQTTKSKLFFFDSSIVSYTSLPLSLIKAVMEFKNTQRSVELLYYIVAVAVHYSLVY